MGRAVIDPLLILTDSLLPTLPVHPFPPVATSVLTMAILSLTIRLRALILSQCRQGLFLGLRA
jgi:hypothetical protein